MAATPSTKTETKTIEAIAVQEPPIVALLRGDEMKARIAEIATRHLPAEKLLRLAVSEFRKTPDLAKCSQASLLLAVMNMARLGLEPGGALGHCYLVPFKDKERGLECTLIIGYRGLVALARRSGVIRRLEAHPVYKADHFVCEFGTSPVLKHTPALEGTRGDVVAAYAVAQLADGSTQVEVMTREELDQVRAASRTSDRGPWVDWTSEMMRKTVVRRLCKYLPLTAEAAEPMRAALTLDNEDYQLEKPDRHQPGKVHPSLRGALGIIDVPAESKPVQEITAPQNPDEAA